MCIADLASAAAAFLAWWCLLAYLCLAGLLSVVEASVDGVSLMPVVLNPQTSKPPRTAAQSQFPRCYRTLPPYIGVPPYEGKNASAVSGEKLPQLDRTDCQDIERSQFDLMGYSLRTAVRNDR